VSHTLPQPVQLVGSLSDDSHPFLLSPVGSVQSAQPAVQPPVYTHLPPVHEGVPLWVASHATPQAPQLDAVFVGVSQPTRFGGGVVQSAHPPLHV
jgi:hypothetical protein